ncbi:MAG: helix-turn-helix domain-containing protein [Verrucomicrobia bacterium]|nr:helix-turn-helix domain-containing protein [Verrucomicrobiota bacterium]
MIRQFLDDNPDALPTAAPQPDTITRPRSETFAITLRLLHDGRSVTEIAKSRNMAESTIESHIVKFMEEGEPLDWRQWVPEETEQRLRDLFDQHGTTALKPIIEAANGTISYTQARILRSVMERGDTAPH